MILVYVIAKHAAFLAVSSYYIIPYTDGMQTA